MSAFLGHRKRVSCGANMAGEKVSQRKMRRDGRSEAEAGLPEESPPPLANIDRNSFPDSISIIISSRPFRNLGWEWRSPHASFDERKHSSPVASSKWLPPDLLTKRPWVGATQQMSSSLQDPTPSRAGCRPRWSWEPTVTFLGLALPQHH